MEGFCDFPEEVWEEIIQLLPPESLILLKCVCKSWHLLINSFVNDPKFVAKHLANMKKKLMSSEVLHFSNLETIIFPEQEEEEGAREEVKSFLTLASNDICDWGRIPCVNDTMKLITREKLTHFDLISHCNGIIFLSRLHEDGVILLMNPALKEIKILSDLYSYDYYDDDKGIVAGFGYDTKANDYKVVVVHPSEDIDMYGQYEAWVYSLSSDSWKEIEMNVKIGRFTFDRQVEYCDGVCYWYYGLLDKRITCFDFGDEVFRHIPLPENAELEPFDPWNESSKWSRMAVCYDSLVLFFYPLKGPLNIDMWVLDSCSGGVEGSYSWTKRLTIKQPEDISRSLVRWGMDELFMRLGYDEIISCCLSAEELSEHSVKFKEFFCDRFVIYASSLVSVHSKKRREAQRSTAEEMIRCSSGSRNTPDD